MKRRGFLPFILGLLVVRAASAESLVTLKGHIPPQIKTATRLERVPPDERVDLSLTVQLDQKALDEAIADMYGPRAPKSRHYLTSAEFAQKFGLAEKRRKLQEFVQDNGLTVAAEDRPESMALHVTGSARQVENALHVRLRHYRAVDGQVFRGHETDPIVSASVAPALGAILGLSNVAGLWHPAVKRVSRAPQPFAKAHLSALTPAFSISGGTGYSGGLAPSDIKTIYGLNSLTLNGAGQVVALFEMDGYIPSDSLGYESAFGLPATPVVFSGVNGSTNLCDGGKPCDLQTLQTELGTSDNGMIEAALDIDMVAALAPNVSKILFYEGGQNSNQGTFDILNQMATDDIAKVVSISYVIFETDLIASYLTTESQIFQRMALQGQTVYVASGDFGDNTYGGTLSPSVNDPASQPYVTGVGGTSLSGSVQSPIETAWSGSGGGVSVYWPTPAYQIGITGAASQQFRNVPDVALNSDPYAPYAIFLGGGWFLIGGTSAAAPLWAGFTALVNQQLTSVGAQPLGFANPAIYQEASGPAYSALFNDITSGSNGRYSASQGYDNVTGWGSYKGQPLITALPYDNASFNVQTAPVNMMTGQSYAVSIMFTNTGNTTWSGAGLYELNSQNPQDNDTWGVTRVPLNPGESVLPGASKTFNFQATAPLKPGIYDFQWGMARDGATETLFGASSTDLKVTVISNDATPPVIQIVAPTNGSTVAGMVAVSGTATDNVGVQFVSIQVDGLPFVQAAGTTSWTYSWDTTSFSNGSHLLTAQAADFSGNTVSAQISVNVNNPLSPTAPVLSSATAHTLTLNWQAPSGGAVDHYTVDLSTHSYFTSYIAPYQDFDAGSGTNFVFTGLDPSTTYYARVRSVDSSGLRSGPSAAVTLATLGLPQLVVIGLQISPNPVAAGQTVAFTATLQNLGAATTQSVTLDAFVGYSAFNGSIASVPPLATGQQWSYTYTYNTTQSSVGDQVVTVQVFPGEVEDLFLQNSVREAGLVVTNGPPPPDTTPPTTPVPIGAYEKSQDSFQLDWNPSTDNVGVGGYQVQLSTDPAFGSLAPGFEQVDVGLFPYYPFTGLVPSTVYYSRVRAYDVSMNASPWSVTADTETGPDITPPSTPVNVAIINLSSSSFTVQWSSSTDNVAVAGYRLDVALDPGFMQFVSGFNGKDIGHTTAYSVTGLPPLTWYYVRVLAYDEVGNASDESLPAQGQTLSKSSVPTQGLVGYWNFDEDAGTLAHDGSGNGYTANINGATWTAGKINSALNFNNSASDVLTPPIALTNAFSISVWVNPAVTSQGSYSRIAETHWDSGLYLGTDTSGTKYKVIVNGATGTSGCAAKLGCAEGGAITSGWHLVTATYDGAVARLYVDAALAATDTFSAPANTDYPLILARYYGSTGYNWNGSLDEVRLYNRALTSAEVSAIYLSAGGSSQGGSAPNAQTTSISPLGNVRVYPNPFKANRGDVSITFDQMPPGATVKIFTVSGRWVATLTADGSGKAPWDLANSAGARVASGLYLYLISDGQGDKTHGKFAIIH